MKHGRKTLAIVLSAMFVFSSITGFAAETEEPVTETETEYAEETEFDAEESEEEILRKPEETEEPVLSKPEETEEPVLSKPEETEEEGVLRREDVIGESETETEDDGIIEFDTLYFVNPEYEGIVSESDLLVTEDDDYGISAMSSAHYTDSIEDAGIDVREAMEVRENPFTIRILYPGTSIDTQGLTELVWDLWEVAFEHTGVPTEGDYMRWQYGGWTVSTSASKADSSSMYLNLKFTVTYYTTYEQEQAVTSTLDSVFASLNLGCKSDYERVKAIYDYICSNIVYDYDNLYDSSHLTKFSAYGALCDGKAVCQGYAVLLYRMLLTAGVDCRVITGNGNGGAHAWNIVCLDGKYYNVDATWDAGRKNYAYFLLPDASFSSHTRGSDYTTSAFYAAYPMATTAYDTSNASAESHHTPGEWEIVTEATCTENGLRRRYCTVCGELVSEEKINAIGHDYFSETANPTCEEDGATVMICEHCGDMYISAILPGGHSYKEEVVKEPTCTESGYSVFTCTVCGDTYEGNHTDPIGHDFVEHTDDPTCIEAGKITAICQTCGEQYVTAVINPTGEHNYDENGECTVCHHLQETEEEEHIHQYEEYDRQDATCSTDGYIKYRCVEGDAEEITAVIPATEEHDMKVTDSLDPTCAEHGYISYACASCGNSELEYTEELPAFGHSFFDAPELTVKPVCTEPGILTETCDVCGTVFEESVPATGHHSVEQSDGSFVCELCGTVTSEMPVPEETEDPETEEPETDPEDLEPLSKYDITNAVITGIEEDYIYTGETIDPEPVVTYDGKVLTRDVDYVLVYAHDTEIGYASVSVIGIGDYYGDVTFHYTIESVEHGDEPDLLPEESETETETETETESEAESKKTPTKPEETEESGTLKKSGDASANNESETSASEGESTGYGYAASEESETESETEGAKGADTVQTSDNTPIEPATFVMLFAGVAFVLLLMQEKRRKA